MTGGEIVGAAAGIAKAAQSALSDDASAQNQLASLAADTPEMREAARAYAARIAVKQKVLLRLYEPLGRLVGISKEYFRSGFPADMAERLAAIPEQDLIAPKPAIAVPAMQALGYSLDEPELKEMYLNLLATATDSRVAASAHPSFAEIIRQLDSEEARTLNQILGSGAIYLALAEVRVVTKGAAGFNVAAQHLLSVRAEDVEVETPSLPMWIDNWVRLGLVDVDYARHVSRPDAYEWVLNRPEYKKVQAEVDAYLALPGHEADARTIEVGKGLLHVTAFGRSFAEAVGVMPHRAATVLT